MELEFSSDQEELRDSIRAVLVKESPVGLARHVLESGEPPSAARNTMVELGWPALTGATAVAVDASGSIWVTGTALLGSLPAVASTPQLGSDYIAAISGDGEYALL